MDLGDGVRAIYQNLTVTDEPIQHRYEHPGVYKVKVKAENMAGHDEATMYIQVTGQPSISFICLSYCNCIVTALINDLIQQRYVTTSRG